jgi:hypothetical protein
VQRSNDGVTDVVLFGLKPGATRERFLATVDAVSAWALQQPGFLSRELSYVPADGRWIEVVRWETNDDADLAAEAELTADACQPMFGLIDWDTIQILRAEPAIPKVSAEARARMSASPG